MNPGIAIGTFLKPQGIEPAKCWTILTEGKCRKENYLKELSLVSDRVSSQDYTNICSVFALGKPRHIHRERALFYRRDMDMIRSDIDISHPGKVEGSRCLVCCWSFLLFQTAERSWSIDNDPGLYTSGHFRKRQFLGPLSGGWICNTLKLKRHCIPMTSWEAISLLHQSTVRWATIFIFIGDNRAIGCMETGILYFQTDPGFSDFDGSFRSQTFLRLLAHANGMIPGVILSTSRTFLSNPALCAFSAFSLAGPAPMITFIVETLLFADTKKAALRNLIRWAYNT